MSTQHATQGVMPHVPATPARERRYRSQLLIPFFGIVLLVFFALIYQLDIALYMRILIWLIKTPFQHPFIDWEWVPSAVKCWQRGVDVYTENTCYQPFAHGRHNYSPLWLRMTFLPYSNVWVPAVGLGLAVLFFASLTSLPPARTAKAFWVTILTTLSPMTVFALERGNVDLIMFLLVIAGVNCWLMAQPARLVGYGIFMLAGLLKFYPFVLLAFALRERPRIFATICATTLLVLLTFVLAFHDELGRILANIPGGSPFEDIFAATNLPYGIAMIFVGPANNSDEHFSLLRSLTQEVIGHAGMALLTLFALASAIAMERRFRLAVALSTIPCREAGFLVAGASIVCGCFYAGHNIDYRAIMLLPALPGLLWLGRSLRSCTGKILFSTAGWAIVPIMWAIPIQQAITTAFGQYGAIAFLHWLLNELAWWFVTTMLLATLAGFVFGSKMGRLVMPPQTGQSEPATTDLQVER